LIADSPPDVALSARHAGSDRTMSITRTLREWAGRVAALVRRGRLDDELREEIEEHLRLRERQLVADGMDPRDAAFEARRLFGNVTAIREETRDMWGFRALDAVLQDLRYAGRVLRRSPVLASAAVLSLAIGIGASAAVFSLGDRLMLQKLAVHDPDALVILRWIAGQTYVFESLNGYSFQNDTETSSTSFSRAAYHAFRAKAANLVDVFGFADLYEVNVSVDGQPQTARAQAVSGNYCSVLGLRPAAGRPLVDSDDAPGAAAVALVSHAYAQRSLGGSDGALGRTLILNGVPFTVVGVMPSDFTGTLQVGQRPDVTIATSMYAAVTRDDDPENTNYWWILMMGRLRPGVSAADAQPVLDLLLKGTVAAAKPDLAAADLPRLVLEPGARGQLEERNTMREPLRMMILVVAIVLLVACANVANLLLARGRARVRELAVRVAIGATRRRIIRQLLTESLLLSALGAAVGLVLTYWLAAALLPALTGSPEPAAVSTSIEPRAVLFVAVLATITSVLVGLVPALRATDLRLASGLQEAGRGADGGAGRDRLSRSLVVAQVALSTVLLTTATLLVFSLRTLQHVEPGFNPRGVLIFTMNAQLNGYAGERAGELYAAALDRLAALPGVGSASLSSHTLIANSSSIGSSRPAGTPALRPGTTEAREFAAKNRTWRLTVDGRFFETMQIGLLQGRTFTRGDGPNAPRVAIVNESLARQLFGNTDVIGRRLVMGLQADAPDYAIVGLVRDARYTSLRSPAPPTVYVHFEQQPVSRATFAIRTAGDPLSIAGAAREAMRQLEPAIPLAAMRTQEDQIRMSVQQERLFSQLATLLGTITVVLSAIGLYGLLAYSVSRRTSEIGIRMALGAESERMRWMVMRQALTLVAIGLALGVVAARWGTQFVESLLFGLAAGDRLPVIVAASVMVIVSVLAAWVPARRAASVDPIVALRA
jgi:predicted permease